MSTTKKIISIIVTVTFLFTNLSYSYASSTIDPQNKLAASSRFRFQKYIDRQKEKSDTFPDIDPGRLAMTMAALNRAFHGEGDIKQVIREENKGLKLYNIEIGTKVKDELVSVPGSDSGEEKIKLKYLVFYFGEKVEQRAYFLIHPDYPLGHPIYKKIRILTEEDKSAISVPGVEGVWFTDNVDRMRRLVVGAVAGTTAVLVLAILSGCTVDLRDLSGPRPIQITDPGDTAPTFLEGSQMPSTDNENVTIAIDDTSLHRDDNGSIKVDVSPSEKGTGENEVIYELKDGNLSEIENLNILVRGDFSGEFTLQLEDREGNVFDFKVSGLSNKTGLIQLPLKALNEGIWADTEEGIWAREERGAPYVDITQISKIKMIFPEGWGSIYFSGVYNVPEKEKKEEPTETIREFVTASEVIKDEPVTLLQNPILNEGISQRLYYGPQFVQNNNAAFIYRDGNLHFMNTTKSDLQDMLKNGITYVYNGRGHTITIAGRDSTGQLKAIILDANPKTDPKPFDRPYRIFVEPERLQRLIGKLNIATIEEIVFETQGADDFVLNGFQRQYAVLPSSEEVTPDTISLQANTSPKGVPVEATRTEEGINMRFSMTAGDNGQFASLNIPTRSGGLPVSEAQAAWKMDEADLGIDSGPNRNRLTNVNGVRSVPGRPGFGNAAEFTPADEAHFRISNDDQTGLHIPGDMTVACWVYQKSNDAANDIIVRYPEADPTSIDYFFYIEGGNGKLKLWNGSTTVESNDSVPVDSWHHIAFTRTGDSVTFYIDGVPSGTFDLPRGAPVEDATVFVGKHGASAYADMILDELGVFDRARTPEEIQAIMNPPVDSSNFSKLALTTLDFRARGNSPFILRLTDDADEELDVFVTGLDPDTIQNFTIDLAEARTVMNPAFNLDNVTSVEIRVEDKFLPVADGEDLEVFIELEGLVGTPPVDDGTRGEYAYDPDLGETERGILRTRLPKAVTVDHLRIDGQPVVGIRSWDGILTPDGLNFKPGNRTFSAFHLGGTIYIPAPAMIMDKILIGEEAKSRLGEALDTRNRIILHHELHEIKGWDHKQAVLTEFEDNINGLNYADIVTILLSVLINNKKVGLDEDFHDLFIKALLAEGMPLSYNTYSEILRQTLGIEIGRELYGALISACEGLVRSYIGNKPVDTEGISAADGLTEKVQKEPGYIAFADATSKPSKKGTILIVLDRFFVRNDTLSDAVAIDTEYFQRFIHFARSLNQNITLTGITSMPETDISTIQLIALIRRNLPEGRQSKFSIYHEVDFTDYHARLVKEGIDIQTAVTILSEESAGKIAGIEAGERREDHKGLKMIAPFGSGYNRAATVWQEFRIATEGIEKEKSEFLDDIIAIARELVDDLVARKQIDQQTADRLIDELGENLIWYIPVYFDPRQYYLSIEQMKILLTNA